MKKSFLNKIISELPTNDLIGNLVSLLRFIKAHKRLPYKSNFNDVLYKFKTKGELYDPVRQFTSDKELVKIFISGVVGDAYNVPTFAVLKSISDIDEFDFTAGQVVKPTHASGHVMFISKLVSNAERDLIKSWLNLNYFKGSRENNYKYICPKIIVEPILFNDKNLKDYKFFCVNGKVKIIQVDFDRHSEHTRKLYDAFWNDLNSSVGYPLSTKAEPKPHLLEDMIKICEKLARYFSFVRIDLYYHPAAKEFYVGEITHCHGGANESFNSIENEYLVSKILFGS